MAVVSRIANLEIMNIRGNDEPLNLELLANMQRLTRLEIK
jgi:hypothetical protein